MSLKRPDLFGERDMVSIAIERIKLYEPMALRMNAAGYWVGISGGKDSAVIYDLVKRAGVRAEYYHNLTTIDAPQTIWHIREHYPDVAIMRPDIPLTQRIPRLHTAPPSRKRRWCCRQYKERGGTGRVVITGVRAAESNRRSGYRIVEQCMRFKTKRFVHPIIDWTDDDVWEYTRARNLPVNPLYREPYNCTRVGCVLCPMALPGIAEESRRHWPKIVAAWERAVRAWYKNHSDCCTISTITSADEYWEWWLSGTTADVSEDIQETLIFEEPKHEVQS